MHRSPLLGLAALAVVGAGFVLPRARAAEEEPAELREMNLLDRQNLEANLRWVLARERAAHVADAAGRKVARARVGVFADAGCWHVSAKAVVVALEQAGVPCRVLDRTLVDAAGFAGLEALVLPGGWSPFEFAAMTPAGGAAVRAFAERGGRVLGICAGAYLLSKTVIWEGKQYPYPIGLYDGTAQGPLAGFLPWPRRSPARLRITKAGATRDVLYYGGGAFVGGSEITVLATYADGGPSILVRPVGKGEVILAGVHLERPSPSDGGDEAAPPAPSGPWLKALLGLK